VAINSTLTNIINDVYILTKRPQAVDRTKFAVKNATLKLHTRDFFPKDFFETGIQFPSASYTLQFAPKSIVPLFRAPSYLRKSDSSSGLGPFLDYMDPREAIDGYGYDKTDAYYMAGTNININSSTALQYLIFGCYVYPNITDGYYASWIADELPYLLTVEAALKFALETGNTTLAKGLQLELEGPPGQPEAGLYSQLTSQVVANPPD